LSLSIEGKGALWRGAENDRASKRLLKLHCEHSTAKTTQACGGGSAVGGSWEREALSWRRKSLGAFSPSRRRCRNEQVREATASGAVKRPGDHDDDARRKSELHAAQTPDFSHVLRLVLQGLVSAEMTEPCRSFSNTTTAFCPYDVTAQTSASNRCTAALPYQCLRRRKGGRVKE
jgi:hypothetical protein